MKGNRGHVTKGKSEESVGIGASAHVFNLHGVEGHCDTIVEYTDTGSKKFNDSQ